MRTLLLALALGLFACGGDDSDDSVVAELACYDMANAWGDWTERCAGDFQLGYDATIEAAGGDCANIVSLRSERDFYDNCLPWAEQLDCDDYEDPDFIVVVFCEDQFER